MGVTLPCCFLTDKHFVRRPQHMMRGDSRLLLEKQLFFSTENRSVHGHDRHKSHHVMPLMLRCAVSIRSTLAATHTAT